MTELNEIFAKPNIDSLDGNTQRIRRNMLIASVVAIFIRFGSDGIKGDESGFIGIKFDNLNVDFIMLFLVLVLAYFIIHFIWASLDHLKENWMRLTGVKIASASSNYQNSSDVIHDANVDERRQSTLFSWWLGRCTSYNEFENTMKSLKIRLDEKKYENAFSDLKRSSRHFNSEITFISAALKRFEEGFWKYQRSQLIRWFVLDLAVPVFLALFAVISIVHGQLN